MESLIPEPGKESLPVPSDDETTRPAPSFRYRKAIDMTRNYIFGPGTPILTQAPEIEQDWARAELPYEIAAHFMNLPDMPGRWGYGPDGNLTGLAVKLDLCRARRVPLNLGLGLSDGNGPTDTTIAQGQHLPEISELAACLASTPLVQVHLRIGVEANNPNNGYTPIDYGRAYEIIADTMPANVENTFCCYPTADPATRPTVYLPPNMMPSRVGINLFNPAWWGAWNGQPADERTFQIQELLSIASGANVPILIGESTTANCASDVEQIAWLHSFLSLLDHPDFRVDAVTTLPADFTNSPWAWGDQRYYRNKPVVDFLKGRL